MNSPKKPSLRDLSRNLLLPEHIPDIMDELESQTDRGVALIAAALVDTVLANAIRTKLAHFDDFESVIFENEAAPLSSFYARTKMARALGIIGPLSEAHLDAIRRIRNQFAHSALKLDFQNDLIAKEIDKLLPDENPSWRPDLTPQRRRYVGTCALLVQALDDYVGKHSQDTISTSLA